MFASNAEKRRVEQFRIDNFHKHLDVCKQCKEQPFNLCKLGKFLIEQIHK